MILRLRYGDGSLVADLRGLRCHELRPSTPRHTRPIRELVAAALGAPLGGLPLADLAHGRRRVTVVVPDATRKAALPEVLPEVLRCLADAGVPADRTTVLVACGTHPAASAEEVSALVGSLPAGIELLQHDARDTSALLPVGVLPTGLTVRLHRRAVECDLLVTISTVQHHYIAGFGGGPKMVFPGVAGYEEIQANHARVLDLSPSPPRRHPGCEPGRLDGNPVAAEIASAALLRAADFSLLMVAGADGSPSWAVAGPQGETFAAACTKVREWFEVTAGPFHHIVVSAGGHPADRTLIQAHKALDAACRFAAPGAEVLFVAACDGGAGSPDMLPFLADPRPEAIIRRLAARYVQYGHTTLRLLEKTARFRVLVHTALDDALARTLGMEPVSRLDEVLDRWREAERGAPVGVMAGAPVFPPPAGSAGGLEAP